MKSDNIKLIREACIKANPEIEERVWKFDSIDFISFRGSKWGVPPHFEYWLIKLTEMNAAIRLWEKGIG